MPLTYNKIRLSDALTLSAVELINSLVSKRAIPIKINNMIRVSDFVIFLWLLTTCCLICRRFIWEFKIIWLHLDKHRKYNIRYRWKVFLEYSLAAIFFGLGIAGFVSIFSYPLYCVFAHILSGVTRPVINI